MKTTLALLVAGLIFLATPVLATAYGGDRHDANQRQTKGWTQERQQTDHYRQDRRHHDQWEKRAKQQLKKDIRKHRRERQHFARHHQPHYAKPVVYRNPAVVLGFPQLVFHIDW